MLWPMYVFIWSISPIFMKSHHPIVRDARISISLNSLPLSVFLYHFQLSFETCFKIVHFRTLFWAIYIGLTLITNFHFSHIYISFLIPWLFMWAASRVLEVSQKKFGSYRKLGPEYFFFSNRLIRIRYTKTFSCFLYVVKNNIVFLAVLHMLLFKISQ